MRKTLAVSVFVLATLTWSLAQNPGATPYPGGQQQPSTSPQAPDATQQNPPSAGAGQNPSQPGSQPGAAQPQGPAASATITEGCLGGSGTDYTLTDKAGTTYKLNFPATANVAALSAHVGEPVRVLGDVMDAGKAGQSSINATKIGRGTGTCPPASSAKPQTPKP
jgi:hypothetical protein